MILPHIVVYLCDQIISLIKIREGSNQSECVLYECFLLATLEEKLYYGFVDGRVSDREDVLAEGIDVLDNAK